MLKAAFRSTAACEPAEKELRVAGNDGLMHSGGGGAGQVTSVGGFGTHRLAAHSDRIALWQGNRRVLEIQTGRSLREVHIDRDGKHILAVPHKGNIEVFDGETGASVFRPSRETTGSAAVGIGGSVLAVQLAKGGCLWWDLKSHTGFELKWAQSMALSNGGTWLGVVTPRGAVRIIDPATGKNAIPAPTPLADVPIRLISFVNRRPDLLVLDEDGVLGRYELANAIRQGKPGEGEDILTVHVEVDQIWGVTGGKHCVMRLPEGDTCSIISVDLHSKEVVHEVSDLHRDAWVDAENGLILEPAPGSALLERELDGRERRVLRSLSDGQWLSYDWKSILDASKDAAGVI